MDHTIQFAFFGGEPLAVPTLKKLHAAGLVPQLIVTNPDRPSGRGKALTPPPAKMWAGTHGILVLQPASLKDPNAVQSLMDRSWDVFVVVAYNAILPKPLLEHPKCGTLNVHPSLLPALRGPSPIRSAILGDMRETGVSVMHMDEQMDHGPIVAQKQVSIAPEDSPMRGRALDALLADEGGALLAETLPAYVNGECTETPQDHTQATYTKKFTKEAGELDLASDPYQNYLKFCAFDGSPGTFFFAEKAGRHIRVKITDAAFEGGSFKILRVIPEGKKEMDYETFRNS